MTTLPQNPWENPDLQPQQVAPPLTGSGLITGAQQLPNAPTPGWTGYSAIDPNTQTVAGQMNTLLNENSQYLQRARSNALQAANQRGLINSSMAAGAGEAAAIDAALPIAQQDARLYGDRAASERQSDLELRRMGYGADLEGGLAEKKAELERSLKQDEWANQRALEVWKQENLAYAQYIKGVADINMQDMDPADKERAVSNLWTQYQAARPLSTALSGITIKDGQIVGGTTPAGGSAQAPVVSNPIATSEATFSKKTGLPPQFSPTSDYTVVVGGSGTKDRPYIVSEHAANTLASSKFIKPIKYSLGELMRFGMLGGRAISAYQALDGTYYAVPAKPSNLFSDGGGG